MEEREVLFEKGYRHEAVQKAIELVKESGRSAEVIICRDVPGHHTGGEDCFCGPRIIQIYSEELE